jgi:cytochrome c oxidase subunit II
MSSIETENGNSLSHPLPDGIVPETMVVKTERRWSYVVIAILGIIAAVIVITGLSNGLHPPSNVEKIDPTRVYQAAEFSESNLGTARISDGSVEVRFIAQQYSFVPQCVTVPQGARVTFRLTSADVLHGFLIGATNVNAMVMPGYVTQVSAHFERLGTYHMPCDEFCGLGHSGMAAEVRVIPEAEFPKLAPTERLRCEAK